MKEEQEILSQAGAIEMVYNWPAGTAYEKFLLALQEGKIIGSKCNKCNTISVPPWTFCERCFTQTKEWPEVPDKGVARTFTIVRAPMAGHPLDTPFAFALIRLDGVDTDLVHVIRSEHLDGIKPGARVEAIWAEEKRPDIFAIQGFKKMSE